MAVRTTAGIDHWSGGHLSVLGLLTAFVGGVTAWLGKLWSGLEDLIEKPKVLDHAKVYIPSVLGVLTATLMMIFFGTVMSFILAYIQLKVGATRHQGLNAHNDPVWLPLAIQACLAAVLTTGIMTFRKVNVNRFSMHAVYRNRLTRAFLGSARTSRAQDPFTEFDPHDNVPLASLLNTGTSLFPVINQTLNITATSNAAWAERKAASFATTPLYCGSSALPHPAQDNPENTPMGAFVPTTHFAALEDFRKGVTGVPDIGPGLGSALTISGAAVSPNWGYHSSRITAFLMTLFNVRLGCWLPNPSKATELELRLAGPRNSLMALINELLGETTDDSQAIYLSDGGHFDNLGVYEMLRRRCRLIVAIDAGADENCLTSDLGGLIRKAEIDLGVSVTMTRPIRLYSRTQLASDKTLGTTALAFAFGEIKYEGDAESSYLLYVKPSFLEGCPADVRAYAFENRMFPHELTADQWFSESQFESYRKLGQHQMDELLSGVEFGQLPSLFVQHVEAPISSHRQATSDATTSKCRRPSRRRRQGNQQTVMRARLRISMPLAAPGFRCGDAPSGPTLRETHGRPGGRSGRNAGATELSGACDHAFALFGSLRDAGVCGRAARDRSAQGRSNGRCGSLRPAFVRLPLASDQ